MKLKNPVFEVFLSRAAIATGFNYYVQLTNSSPVGMC
jgi:hypothetical protein